MDRVRKKKNYRLLILLALILCILSFTPLVMPGHRYKPMLLHLPYTLWTGILASVLLVLLTWLSARMHPGREEDES